MKPEEIEDLEEYMNNPTEDRHEIFDKYLEEYKEHIDLKALFVRKLVHPDEVLSDAAISLDGAFEEIYNKGYEAFVAAISSTSLLQTFKRHLAREVRNTENNNRPLSQVIRADFKKTVSKTRKKAIYEGYETSSAVDGENTLVEVNYVGSPENENQETIRALIKVLIPEEDSPIYLDFCDRYLDGKTLQSIADEPRNGGMSYQNVAKRMGKFMEKLGMKVRLEERKG